MTQYCLSNLGQFKQDQNTQNTWEKFKTFQIAGLHSSNGNR